MSSIDTALPLLIDRFADFKMGDDDKISAVIAKCVDPARRWKPIQNFKDYFSENITFDGGFGLEPLIKKDWDESDFVLTWNPKLTSYLRKIRNALVHARDVRMGQVISPTVKNSDRLRPWVGVIEEVACQVALFRNI